MNAIFFDRAMIAAGFSFIAGCALTTLLFALSRSFGRNKIDGLLLTMIAASLLGMVLTRPIPTTCGASAPTPKSQYALAKQPVAEPTNQERLRAPASRPGLYRTSVGGNKEPRARKDGGFVFDLGEDELAFKGIQGSVRIIDGVTRYVWQEADGRWCRGTSSEDVFCEPPPAINARPDFAGKIRLTQEVYP